MLTPEQSVRLECVQIISSMAPQIQPQEIIKFANPLSEWILGSDQKLPLEIVGKE
jgi:hypothetical protein